MKRRSRNRPTPTGKRVSAQARDLLWFSKIHEHGPLSSSYLHAFSKLTHLSEKRALERMTDLFHETNTPDSGTYLSRPLQQFRTIDSRYNQLIYDLTPASLKALQRPKPSNRNGPWLHQYLVACITASIEIAALGGDAITYIPQSKILRRANARLVCMTEFVDPASQKLIRGQLIPDAIFGLEYHRNDQSYFRFFAVEADRGTEPITSRNLNRKSYQRNLFQYCDYVENERYKQHLNLTAPLIVLHVFSSAQRRNAMMKLAAKTWPQGNPYMCFNVIDGFAEAFKPLPPQTHLLFEPWLRVGATHFRIEKI